MPGDTKERTQQPETYGVRYMAALKRHFLPYFGIYAAVLLVGGAAGARHVADSFWEAVGMLLTAMFPAAFLGGVCYALIVLVLAIRRPGRTSRDGTRSPR